MTKLPTLQRRIARYLSTDYDENLSYDEHAIKIVELIVDYLTEQSVKRTEISVEDFVCANIKDDDGSPN